MKRSDALAPLSRDHHAALVVARRLTHATEQDRAAAAAAFVDFLAGHELGHFALEESVLLPAVPPGTAGEEMATRIRQQHAQLREDLQALQGSPDTATIAGLRDIGTRLRAHVLLEEREFFPFLEQTLDERALDELGARLEH